MKSIQDGAELYEKIIAIKGGENDEKSIADKINALAPLALLVTTNGPKKSYDCNIAYARESQVLSWELDFQPIQAPNTEMNGKARVALEVTSAYTYNEAERRKGDVFSGLVASESSYLSVVSNRTPAPSFGGALALPPEEAARIRKHLQCLLIVKPVPPYASSYTRKENPNRAFNYYSTHQHRVIFAEPIQVWLVNASSGQVLMKVASE